MSAMMWISAIAVPIVFGALAAYLIPRVQELVRHRDGRHDDSDL